jgi:hypothetical protein
MNWKRIAKYGVEKLQIKYQQARVRLFNNKKCMWKLVWYIFVYVCTSVCGIAPTKPEGG